MTLVSVKRVSKEKLQQELDDAIVMGWTLQNNNDNLAILTKSGGWGTPGWHIFFLLFTGWWTVLLGNVLYAVYAHFSKKQELQIIAE